MNRILVRADDLGYSRAVNYGIYDTVHKGIVKNVGVMTNMPSTKMGLTLLRYEDVDLGMHTDITNGKPVLAPEKVPSLVDKNGYFKRSRVYWENKGPDFTNLDEVVNEIDAQYHRFLELVGRQPDYFEGHAVMSSNFIKGLEIVANKYDLPLLRFGFDGKPVPFKKNTKFVSYMGGMESNYKPIEVVQKMINDDTKDAIPMMVCHPGYLDQYILNTSRLTINRTKEAEMLMSEEVKELLTKSNVKLVRYSECE